MYLFKIRQMQKIEQVMLDLSVILPAPENPYFFFLNMIYWKTLKIDDPENVRTSGDTPWPPT